MSSVLDTTAQEINSIYKYSASFQFVLGTEATYVEPVHIKSIVVDYDYDNLNMPLLYITAALDKNLVDSIIQNQDKGLIIFTIQRCITNSDMPNLYKDYLNDTFIYFIEDDVNKDNKLDYGGSNKDREDIFNTVTIGLMSLDLLNKNKNPANGVLSGNKSSILYYIAGHLPLLMEPPTNNAPMKSVFLPPKNTVSKLINYINDLSVIYDTPYRFFMDYDVTYILSSSGKKVPQRADKITSVLLTLRNTLNPASQVEGMSLDESNGICKIDIDGARCELADYKTLSKSFSTINAVTTTIDKSTAEVADPGDNLAKKSQRIRLPNGNDGLLDNMSAELSTSEIQILLSKEDIDSSLLTINREYIINGTEVYNTDRYNGKYLLSRKRELYIRKDELFTMTPMLLLKKLPS